MPNSGKAELEDNLKKKEGDCVKVLIGRDWKESSNGSRIEVVNPATGELIDKVPNISLEDVDEAVKVAKDMQKEWEKVSIYDRG